MINKNKLLSIIASALQIKQNKVKLTSNSQNIEQWDSLGHLNILTKLDEVLEGKTQKIKKLSQCDSVKSLINLLSKHKLIK